MKKFNPILLSKIEVFKYNKLLDFCEEENEKEVLHIINSEENDSIIESVFQCSCYNGKLNIVKFILYIYPSIKMSSKNECAFRNALIRNHICICKWMLEVNFSINLTILKSVIDEKFWEFCITGNQEYASWLFNLYPSLTEIITKYLYNNVCINNHINVAKWINTVKKYYFILELNSNETKILNYSSHPIKDRKWLERRIPILAHNTNNNNDNIFKYIPYDVIRYICQFI